MASRTALLLLLGVLCAGFAHFATGKTLSLQRCIWCFGFNLCTYIFSALSDDFIPPSPCRWDRGGLLPDRVRQTFPSEKNPELRNPGSRERLRHQRHCVSKTLWIILHIFFLSFSRSWPSNLTSLSLNLLLQVHHKGGKENLRLPPRRPGMGETSHQTSGWEISVNQVKTHFIILFFCVKIAHYLYILHLALAHHCSLIPAGEDSGKRWLKVKTLRWDVISISVRPQSGFIVL